VRYSSKEEKDSSRFFDGSDSSALIKSGGVAKINDSAKILMELEIHKLNRNRMEIFDRAVKERSERRIKEYSAAQNQARVFLEKKTENLTRAQLNLESLIEQRLVLILLIF
jgi:RPA family protein